MMALQQTGERAAFARRKRQDRLRSPPRGQRASPAVCLGGGSNEIHPRRAGLDGDEWAIDRDPVSVLKALRIGPKRAATKRRRAA
jgi:hypothetical protein